MMHVGVRGYARFVDGTIPCHTDRGRSNVKREEESGQRAKTRYERSPEAELVAAKSLRKNTPGRLDRQLLREKRGSLQDPAVRRSVASDLESGGGTLHRDRCETDRKGESRIGPATFSKDGRIAGGRAQPAQGVHGDIEGQSCNGVVGDPRSYRITSAAMFDYLTTAKSRTKGKELHNAKRGSNPQLRFDNHPECRLRARNRAGTWHISYPKTHISYPETQAPPILRWKSSPALERETNSHRSLGQNFTSRTRSTAVGCAVGGMLAGSVISAVESRPMFGSSKTTLGMLQNQK